MGRSPHGEGRGARAGRDRRRDPRDSTSAEAPVPDYTKALDGNVKGLKLDSLASI